MVQLAETTVLESQDLEKNKIIVALDVDSTDQAIDLVEQLKGSVAGFKVGLELVNAVGVDIFGRLQAAGADRIFYDAKLHDIPNTVAGACRMAARHGLWMINVHASGGSRMISAAADALATASERAGVQTPLLIAVTLLTSISEQELHDELRVALSPPKYVVDLARLAQDAGAKGVVACPHEIAAVRTACGPDFLIVTPGVRPAGSDHGDQRRVMTPREAVALGASHLVIGRPITASSDPAEAARQIALDISAAD